MPELKTVPLEKIRIPDIRVSSVLDPEQKALLASTIREVGVVQDIIVRDLGQGEFELVAGKGGVAAGSPGADPLSPRED